MKKLAGFLSIPVLVVLAVFACSKSPVGPSMSSMSISANSTSTTVTTTCTTTSGGEATSVSTSQTGTVSTQTGNTGVESVNGSTGVNSSGTSSASTGSTSTDSTITVKIDGTIDHTIYTTSSRTPTFAWDASGVDSSYQLVRISIMCINPVQTMWVVEGVARSRGSVVYGNTSGGTVLAPKVDLTPGTYAFDIDVYDTNSNSVLGGGNFIVQ
ncbi:MAG: hypothetical protein V1752_08990 [Candidatus Firestonebacteria bacterium]